MRNPRFIFVALVTLLSLIAAFRWFYAATAGFNIWLDLMFTVDAVFFVLPLFVTAMISVKYLVRARKKPDYRVPIVAVCILSLIMISLSITITFGQFSPGPVRDSIFADSMRRTDDGLFEYRIELVNAFQRNAHARIFVRDLITREEMHIPIDMPPEQVRPSSIPAGRRFLWGRMEKDEDLGVYVFTMPAGRGFRSTYINGVSFEYRELPVIREIGHVTFRIDFESRTATELSRRMVYSPLSRSVNNEYGRLIYSFTVELIDTYEQDIRIRTEAFLIIRLPDLDSIRTIPPTILHTVPLSIYAELLENNDLRRQMSQNPIMWVIVEQTDLPDQFIARTTADLSEEVTFTFLIDIPSLTATRIDE